MTAMFLVCAVALAQSDSFEVASVKPGGPTALGQRSRHGGPGTLEPSRVTFTNVPLSYLLSQAYDVWQDQVSGPAWLSGYDGHRYTIVATMPPTTTKGPFQVMLQNLLKERFQLRMHREQQTRPGYELVVAEGGPKMEEWMPGTGPSKIHPRFDSASPRGLIFLSPMEGGRGPLRIYRRDTMEGFCRGLGAHINMSNGVSFGGPQARVVDRTGLTGIYEFVLEFSGVFSPGPGADGIASDPGPTIFHALEKQLGLKLRKIKEVPVEVIVVDHADKVPTEN
jgi:uncharacterized protein (TIGR03435 family)